MSEPLWISGEIQADVDDDFGPAANEIEAAVNAALEGMEFGAGFDSLNLIPILLEEDDPDYGEIRGYDQRDRGFDFRLKISHAAFKVADALEQRRLVMENILRSVEEMKKMGIKDVDCAKLENAIREVAAAKGWLPKSRVH